MKISETIERECCQTRDLRKYQGLVDTIVKTFKPEFCIHCGQIWIHDREMGPGGSYEPNFRKIIVDEKEEE